MLRERNKGDDFDFILSFFSPPLQTRKKGKKDTLKNYHFTNLK